MIWLGLAKDFPAREFKGVYYIYALKETPWAEPFYIGKGSYTRAKTHRFAGNTRLRSRLDSLNYEHYVEVLAKSSDEQVVFELERFYISKFKIVEFGGSLLNLLSGSKKSESSTGYFDIPENKMARQINFAKLKGKPFFAAGFIFPSKALAFKTLGLSKNSLKYLIKCDKAFLIDDNWKTNNELFLEKMEEENKIFLEKVASLKKQHPLSKPVMVAGIVYPSVQIAAIMSGVSKSAIQGRIKRGNQKQTYFIEECINE